MTQNTISPISSTVVVGLGTQIYNVLTTGIYTVSFDSFLPYLAAGSPPQTAFMANQITNVTAVGDTSGSLNSTFFTTYSGGNLYGFYVWYNINSAGVDPAPGGGLLGIQVAAATGANAATIATATIAAINANANAIAAGLVASAGASGHFILTNSQYGAVTATANGTASPGFSYSVTQTGSFGTPPASGLTVVASDGTTVLGRWGNPSPTQPLLSGSVSFNATAADVISVVFSSLSTADSGLIQPKTILNVYQGK